MKFFLVFMLILVCVQITAAWENLYPMCRKFTTTSCGGRWVRYDGGRCLRFPNIIAHFSYAKSYCHRYKSKLVSIHSDAERDHLSCLIFDTERKPIEAWIGAIRKTWRSGLRWRHGFVWSDGSRFNYSSWAPGEPNNKREKCVVTNFGGYGKWNDLDCHRQRHFVCAK